MAKAVTLVNTPNKTGNFYPADDQWKLEQVPMKASTAMAEGAAIMPETSGADVTGYFTLMGVENAGGDDVYGILAEPIAATDADYATTGKRKGVRVPRTLTAKSYFKVGAGTFTVADIGKRVEFHSDSVSLAVDTVGKGATITDYISSARGKCVFNLPATETA